LTGVSIIILTKQFAYKTSSAPWSMTILVGVGNF
jgi:hypothetical protein